MVQEFCNIVIMCGSNIMIIVIFLRNVAAWQAQTSQCLPPVLFQKASCASQFCLLSLDAGVLIRLVCGCLLSLRNYPYHSVGPWGPGEDASAWTVYWKLENGLREGESSHGVFSYSLRGLPFKQVATYMGLWVGVHLLHIKTLYGIGWPFISNLFSLEIGWIFSCKCKRTASKLFQCGFSSCVIVQVKYCAQFF